MTQAFVPGMKDAGYGRIINIISTSVVTPIPGLGVSNTIRGAVANWGRTLAVELGAFGITVNNLLPGFTGTDRLATLFEGKAKKLGCTPEEIREQAIRAIPAARIADPEELASVALFLASPAASYVNGVNLPVDGGRVAKG
jgi:3-oxoacyl-[acyl-carrier protein] reductase